MSDLTQSRLTEIVSPACQRYGVEELSLFGSQARREPGPESDYDFLVRFNGSRKEKLSDRYFGLLFFLEDELQSSVDLLVEDAIRNPHLRRAILEDKQVLYAAQLEDSPV